MADYGIGRTGGSLRDALNQLYPMTGMGEYNTMYPPTMFPPNTGAEPSGQAPVPIPPQRPPMLPMNLAPQAPGPGPAPGLALPGGIAPPAVTGGITAGDPRFPGIRGGVNFPIGPDTYATAGGGIAPGGNYAARLGLVRQF